MSDSVSTLLERADLARRENRLPDAHRDLLEAVALCRRTGTRRDLVRVLKRLGQVERYLNHGGAALASYEEAVAICRDEDDPLALAHTIRHVGDIHQDAGRMELAEPCYHEALAIYRNHEQTDLLDLANAIRPLAILKDEAGEFEEAIRLWTEARDLYVAVDVIPGVAESSARLARLTRQA